MESDGISLEEEKGFENTVRLICRDWEGTGRVLFQMWNCFLKRQIQMQTIACDDYVENVLTKLEEKNSRSWNPFS